MLRLKNQELQPVQEDLWSQFSKTSPQKVITMITQRCKTWKYFLNATALSISSNWYLSQYLIEISLFSDQSSQEICQFCHHFCLLQIYLTSQCDKCSHSTTFIKTLFRLKQKQEQNPQTSHHITYRIIYEIKSQISWPDLQNFYCSTAHLQSWSYLPPVRQPSSCALKHIIRHTLIFTSPPI